jgi:hypothetical protein
MDERDEHSPNAESVKIGAEERRFSVRLEKP